MEIRHVMYKMTKEILYCICADAVRILDKACVYFVDKLHTK